MSKVMTQVMCSIYCQCMAICILMPYSWSRMYFSCLLCWIIVGDKENPQRCVRSNQCTHFTAEDMWLTIKSMVLQFLHSRSTVLKQIAKFKRCINESVSIHYVCSVPQWRGGFELTLLNMEGVGKDDGNLSTSFKAYSAEEQKALFQEWSTCESWNGVAKIASEHQAFMSEVRISRAGILGTECFSLLPVQHLHVSGLYQWQS